MSPQTFRHRVAIFDIDGTIFRSSLLIELTEALIEEGIFPKRARRIYEIHFNRWLNRKGPYEMYIDSVVVAFMGHMKGVRYKDFERIAKKVTKLHEHRVYRYTRDLIKELKAKHYYLLAISNSPLGILKSFCASLGFNKVYGRLYEVDARGRFTGKILFNELISDKAKILERAIAKEGLSLTDSVGVGDTESDIAFLRFVDTPICFNPNQKLYTHARRAGWSIVVERKDVIYEIPKA